MMSIGVRRSVSVSVSVMSSEVSSVITIARLSSGGWLSLSLSISISGPLAVVVSSVASTIPSMITSMMAVVTVSRLGSNNSEEDDGESNQKFHVVRSSFST